jgi:hypothetical protein
MKSKTSRFIPFRSTQISPFYFCQGLASDPLCSDFPTPLLLTLVLAYFPKVGFSEIHALCVSVYSRPPLNFDCLNQSLWNLVRISWYPSPSERRTSQLPRISLCLHLHVAGQRLGKYVTETTNINSTIQLLDVSFSMQSVSYQGT